MTNPILTDDKIDVNPQTLLIRYDGDTKQLKKQILTALEQYPKLKEKYDKLIGTIKERRSEEIRHIRHRKLSGVYQSQHNCKLEVRQMEVLLESMGESYE